MELGNQKRSENNLKIAVKRKGSKGAFPLASGECANCVSAEQILQIHVWI